MRSLNADSVSRLPKSKPTTQVKNATFTCKNQSPGALGETNHRRHCVEDRRLVTRVNSNKPPDSLITLHRIRTSFKIIKKSINYSEQKRDHGCNSRTPSTTTHQGLQQRSQKERLEGSSKLPRRTQHPDCQESCSVLNPKPDSIFKLFFLGTHSTAAILA